MDFAGGLPYDDTCDTLPTKSAVDDDGDHPMLDRPLDDYNVASAGAEAQPVPEHVQSLISRMGRGKIYLVDETPGIIHHDSERRLKRDPRLVKLVGELDKQDPTAWLEAISETIECPIRPNALFLSSELIKHLSTSKVFSWATELGAGVMGIEWLNDVTLLLLFPTAAATLLALSLLSKAGFDPTEGDDPLLERAAHSFPISLLPHAEPDPAHSLNGKELLDVESDGDQPVRRKGRGTFSSAFGGQFDLEPLAPAKPSQELPSGINPNARVTLRYATVADSDLRKQAKQSEWYQRHGRNAGKEIAPRRSYGRNTEPLELKDRVGSSGEGREFARRIGRERRQELGPYARPRQSQADLDRDLDAMTTKRLGDDSMEQNMDRAEGIGGSKRRGRERHGKDDLDRQLDELFAARGSTL